MKIYLAAKYSRNGDMRDVRTILEERGHCVTSRWINGGHDIADDANADAERTKFAIEDHNDLRVSDLMLWFSEPEKIDGRNRGGRHVEFGLAIAWDIPIIVVGRKENVFHWMPGVVHVHTLLDAIDLVEKKIDRSQKPLGEGHIDCPCWSSGVFVQVPCEWHDGHGKYPKGAYEKSLRERAAAVGEQ